MRTRDRLVAAMADALLRRGYSGASVQEILTWSKVPKGSLYHHFPGGKEQLAAEAVMHLGAVQLDRMVQFLQGDLGKGLASWLSWLCDQLEGDGFRRVPALSRLVGETEPGSLFALQLAAYFEDWEQRLLDHLVQPTRLEVSLLVGLVEGTLALTAVHRNRKAMDALVARLPQLVASGFSEPVRGRRSPPPVHPAAARAPAPEILARPASAEPVEPPASGPTQTNAPAAAVRTPSGTSAAVTPLPPEEEFPWRR